MLFTDFGAGSRICSRTVFIVVNDVIGTGNLTDEQVIVADEATNMFIHIQLGINGNLKCG